MERRKSSNADAVAVSAARAAAAGLLARWENRSASGAAALPEVLLGSASITRLNGFCALGYCAALYALSVMGENRTLHSQAIECIALGGAWWAWNLLAESRWGELVKPWDLIRAYRPLRWPTTRRPGRSGSSGSSEPNRWPPLASAQARSDKEDRYTPAYLPQLMASMEVLFPEASLRVHEPPGKKHINFAAFGVHAPTLLEPVFAWHRLRPAGTFTQVNFYGASHPRVETLLPEVCQERTDGMSCWQSGLTSQKFWRWIDERPSIKEAVDSLSGVLARDPFFKIVDAIVCGGGHSPTLCMMVRMVTDLPMYFTLQAPLAFRMPKGSEIRASLVAYFREMTEAKAGPHGRTVVTTSLFFLQRQVWAQMGRLLPVVRNHNLYVPEVQRNPDVDEVLFWQNHVSLKANCAVGLFRILKNICPPDFPFRLVFKNIARLPGYRPWRRIYALGAQQSHMPYEALASRFAAAVIFPHDIGMISFDDVYRMLIPVFMPTDDMVATMAFAHLASTENYPWYLLRNEHAMLQSRRAAERQKPPWPMGGPPSLPHERDDGEDRLFLGDDLLYVEKLSRCVATANFALFPHVVRFRSLSELLEKLQAVDLETLSREMNAFNKKSWEATSEFYSRAGRHLRIRYAPPAAAVVADR